MEQTNESFANNINEVIKPGEETDFTFFIQLNSGAFAQKVLPSFLKNSFIARFGEDTPTELEYSLWLKDKQSDFKSNESADKIIRN